MIAYAADISVQLAQVNANPNPGGIFTQLLQFGFLIAGLLAFGSIVYGAAKYTLAAGNSSAQSDAKDRVTQSLLGLLLLIGSALILYTINPQILESPIPALSPVEVVLPPMPTSTVPGSPYRAGVTDAQARQQLTAAGIGIKPGVSLESIQQAVVDELVQLKNECHCEVYVTSGTDGVHRPGSCSHAAGWKVDLRVNKDLDDYIIKHFRFSGVRGNDKADTYDRGSAVYARESDHWDIKASCPYGR